MSPQHVVVRKPFGLVLSRIIQSIANAVYGYYASVATYLDFLSSCALIVEIVQTADRALWCAADDQDVFRFRWRPPEARHSPLHEPSASFLAFSIRSGYDSSAFDIPSISNMLAERSSSSAQMTSVG